MSTHEKIIKRVKENSASIVQLPTTLDSKWASVLIAAWKNDLNNLLNTTNQAVDKELIQNNQNYLLNLNESLLPWKSALLETLRKTFREVTNQHNARSDLEKPVIQTVQLIFEFPEPNEEPVVESAIEPPSTYPNSEESTIIMQVDSEDESIPKPSDWRPKWRSNKKWVKNQRNGDTSAITESEKKQEIVSPFEIPESYTSKSIFWSSNTPPNKVKIKSVKEMAFDATMLASLNQKWWVKPIIKQDTMKTNTSTQQLLLTTEEKKQIKTLYEAEPCKEITLWSVLSKIDDIKAIYNNYTTIIMHYTEIMSILINQNQTEKTAWQIDTLETIRHDLYELKNYYKRMNNNRFQFKANEQKNNSWKKIKKIWNTIKLLVQFN
jgi:hypothetical protein